MTEPSEDNKVSKVRLELYASGLRNVAGIGRGTSDPFAVVTQLASDPQEQPKVLGKTETIRNSLSPRWTTCFEVDYMFGCLTRINVGIFDETKKGKHNKPMGSAMFELGEILGARGNTKAKQLRCGGTLFVRATAAPERSAEMGTLNLTLRGEDIKNTDGVFGGKSDPFFEVLAKIEAPGGITWQPIYRSQYIKSNANPRWEPFSLDLSRLCGGDYNKTIMIMGYDWEKSGKHHSLGSFETTVNAIVAAAGDPSSSFTLKRRDKPFGKIFILAATIDSPEPMSLPSNAALATTTTPSPAMSPVPAPVVPPESYAETPSFAGALDRPPLSLATATAAIGAAATLSSLKISEPVMEPIPYMASNAPLPPPLAPPSATAPMMMMTTTTQQQQRRPKFLDYLAGGCQIELSIAIDFTGSNGDPRRPGTLHYIHPDGQLNDYEKALTAVGSIVARYDSDQKISVWGFGAKYGGVIRHCFQVGNAAELDGIAGVLEGYRSVFRTGLTMSGPTVFDEVIGVAAAQARSKQDASRVIGQQSYKILLILTDGAVSDVQQAERAIQAASDAPMSIVIVGIGNADFSSMQFLDDFHGYDGTMRDICQFVEFRKYADNKQALTRETLEEIPDQLVTYFDSRGIRPLPAISGSTMNLVPDEATDEDIDLSMDINPDGEIKLENYQDAVYDDTKYDTMAAYKPGAYGATAPPAYAPGPANPYQPVPPPGPYGMTSSQAYQPYQPGSSIPSGQYTPGSYQPYQASSPVPPSYSGYGGTQPTHSYRPPSSTTYNNGTFGNALSGAAAAPTPAPVFHVQVPPGVTAGTQLQIQHPSTGKAMIVTIPPGIPPGGTFPVKY